MKKTPLARVKEQFKNKEKLVEAVKALATDALWLDRVNDAKGLARISNAKLLRLHDALSSAKKDFGSRDKLIAAILELEKRSKDDGYKGRLERSSLPSLLDQHRASTRRAAQAKAKAEPAAKPEPKKKARPATKKGKTSEARPS